MPDLNYRLLSPQDHFMEIQRLDNTEGSFTVTCYKSAIYLSYQMSITINYEQKKHLPMMHDYKSIYRTAEYLAMTVCVNS